MPSNLKWLVETSFYTHKSCTEECRLRWRRYVLSMNKCSKIYYLDVSDNLNGWFWYCMNHGRCCNCLRRAWSLSACISIDAATLSFMHSWNHLFKLHCSNIRFFSFIQVRANPTDTAFRFEYHLASKKIFLGHAFFNEHNTHYFSRSFYKELLDNLS